MAGLERLIFQIIEYRQGMINTLLWGEVDAEVGGEQEALHAVDHGGPGNERGAVA